MMKFIRASLSLSIFLIGLVAHAVHVHLPVPEIEELPNGLKLVWFANDKLPVVDLALLIKSGYRDDLIGKSGTAELVGQSLDRGAAGLSAEQLARAVEKLGASRYVSVEDDHFTMGMHGLAPDASVLLDLLAKMALKPDFADAEVLREKTRLAEKWNHLSDSGETLSALAFHRFMTQGTSYARGDLATLKELKGLAQSDVVSFHKTHFTPRNSVLMVVGRVDRAPFKKQILELFGSTWQGEEPKHTYKDLNDPRLKVRFNEVVVVDRPGLTQAQVRIGFRAPPLKSPDHYALVVANALLGEYFNSRLNSVIRDKLGLTYGISSAFSYSQDLANFGISSSTRNEATGQLIQKTLEILKKLKDEPIPQEEIQMAKEYLVGGYPLSVSTLGSVAARWLSGYVYDLGPDYLNEFVPKVNAVTQTEVQNAVKKHFDLNHLVMVVAGDGAEMTKSLSQSKIRYFKVPAKDLF